MSPKDVDRKTRTVPTGEQLRIAKLTADSHPADDDQEIIKKLIKKVIETTLCTKSQAEIALFDNDNDVEAAVIQILENPHLDWTEQKNKKDKKRDEEAKAPVSSRVQSSRGRGQYHDRSAGRGRVTQSSNTTRGNPHTRGATHSGRGSRGGHTREGWKNMNETPKAMTTDTTGADDWNTTEEVVKDVVVPVESEPSAPLVQPITNGSASAPISFAAVAAAGANKEKRRQQLLQQQQQVASPRQIETVERSPPVAEALEPAKEPSAVSEEPAPIELPPVEEVHVTQNVAVEWASKLKTDLGIGVPATTSVQFVASPEPASTVEFVDGRVGGLSGYEFGYEVPAVEILTPGSGLPSQNLQGSEPLLFNRSPVVPPSSQPASVPSKPDVPSHSSDYPSMKSSPPAVPSSYAQVPRTLSFDTTSVSYVPQDRGTQPQRSQASTTQPMHVVNAPPGLQQQVPFGNPHLQYSNYPYLGMNMYSPLRADDAGYAAAALMQYPFGMGQIDLTTLMTPQGASISGGQSQPPHRNDNHTAIDINKYPGGVNSTRDNSVAPPPGYGAHNTYIQPQPNVPNMFVHQQYPGSPFPYMMPTLNQGRPMYNSGEEDRSKTYDRSNGNKQGGAQQTPPPHFQQHNGYMANIGKPKQQAAYGHGGGWNN